MNDTKNDSKKLGRPKSFNEEVALEAAVEIFWRKGYHGASIKDLTSAMGIHSPSLYATYGDKESLFIRCIEHYMGSVSCSPLDAFENAKDIQSGVSAFFETILHHACEEQNGALGCFLSSCVVTCADTVEGVKPLLQAAIEYSEQRLVAGFERAKLVGELAEDFPSAQRARLMFDLRQGPLFRVRSGVALEEVGKDLVYWQGVVLGHE